MPATPRSKKAVVLLSGGLDSATVLYWAKKEGFKCLCLTFDYGQRHHKEILAAKMIAGSLHCPHQIIKIQLPWRGSALLDRKIKLPKRSLNVKGFTKEIPSTYVPARNIIFLSFAVSCAEASNAEAIFIGANSVDYSGYPDCRPQFYRNFSSVIKAGTKKGIEGNAVKILTPLIHKSKRDIIRLGERLRVPYGLTWSCYQGGKRPCGKCDSCLLRKKGFQEARTEDPLSACAL